MLFNGPEFQNAIIDYNAVMMPSINLSNKQVQENIKAAQQDFIQKANKEGWMLAGSYFINLARLNSADLNTDNVEDTTADLNATTANLSMINLFGSGSSKTCPNATKGTNSDLCVWFNGDSMYVQYLINLITASNIADPALPQPDLSKTGLEIVTGPPASTVYGYINNAAVLKLPNQPNTKAPEFHFNLRMPKADFKQNLPEISFPCHGIRIFFFTFCLGQWIGELIYTYLIKTLVTFILQAISQMINVLLLALLYLPLKGIALIFQSGLEWLQVPGINPVIALANMRMNYINYASQLWIYLIGLTALYSLAGPVVMILIMMTMPLLATWLAIMLAIGFITAYYIPFVPYMIFTFGSIGWLMAVIEAMVAAPIVALGITHPEGEGPFGKGEHAIMILMNVFLRPAMMIIGYIAAIALSYVSVWVINAGFSNVMSFIQGSHDTAMGGGGTYNPESGSSGSNTPAIDNTYTAGSESLGYTGWASIYAFFFSIIIYVSMYLTVVQKAFTLIVVLPDKVLRWIGGPHETAGQDVMQWTEETKQKAQEAAKESKDKMMQTQKRLAGAAKKGAAALGGGGPDVSADGGDSTDDKEK